MPSLQQPGNTGTWKVKIKEILTFKRVQAEPLVHNGIEVEEKSLQLVKKKVARACS